MNGRASPALGIGLPEARIGWQIRPLHPLFGAEIIGFDHADCNEATVAALTEALATYGLLLFRAMACDDDGLTALASRFGPMQNLSGRPEAPLHVLRVTNLDKNGSIKPVDEPSRKQHDANRLWHADGTFMLPGTSFSFLHARVVTREGGYTEFCDTRVAWDQLSPDQRLALAHLQADHSMLQSWKMVGVDMPGASRATMPAITRPLVSLHKPSGRKALMIPSHVERIDGFDYDAMRDLLQKLTSSATAPDKIYQHRWTVGDLLVWDNRCMLHRVTAFRGSDEPRDLRTCRVLNVEDLPESG